MRADGLRQQVLDNLSEVVAEGEEEALSTVLEFSRALLLALASAAPDEEVEPGKLTVKSGTAARILTLHQEYVRELIRKDEMKATKQNGEFQIPLAEVIDFQAKAQKRISPAAHAHQGATLRRCGCGRTHTTRQRPAFSRHRRALSVDAWSGATV